MIAAACRPFHGRMAHRIRLTGPSAKFSFFKDDAILFTLTRLATRSSLLFPQRLFMAIIAIKRGKHA